MSGLVERLAEKWTNVLRNENPLTDEVARWWLNAIADEMEAEDADRWYYAANWLRSQTTEGDEYG